MIAKRVKGYLLFLSIMGIRGIAKTLYINFKMFPLRTAVRLPVYCSGNTRFASLRGRIQLACPARHGLVKFGFHSTDMFVPSNNVVNINVNGTLRFKGGGDFAGGVSLNVGHRGTLIIGNDFFFNSQVKIVCHERMEVGEQVRVSWECQLLDTDFHYVREVATGTPLKKTAPVSIGKNVWLGNRVTVSKGCKLPDYCIVASGSLCNKDYSGLPDSSLIAGSPAKLIRSGVRRVASYEEDEQIDRDAGLA